MSPLPDISQELARISVAAEKQLGLAGPDRRRERRQVQSDRRRRRKVKLEIDYTLVMSKLYEECFTELQQIFLAARERMVKWFCDFRAAHPGVEMVDLTEEIRHSFDTEMRAVQRLNSCTVTETGELVSPRERELQARLADAERKIRRLERQLEGRSRV